LPSPKPPLGRPVDLECLCPTALCCNSRLRALAGDLARGNFDEFGYRAVTSAAGWQLGVEHLWTGVGPGNVPLLYQSALPSWSGRTAELTYQLHGTPQQLWAEFGLWSVPIGLGAIALVSGACWRWWVATPALLPGCVCVGLVAYGVLALTDYQLGVVAIAGVLGVYAAYLATRSPQPEIRGGRPAGHALLGLLLAIAGWLVPVHRAWAAADGGFRALAADRPEEFAAHLESARALAPWEPYYPYQLGWVAGDRAQRGDSDALPEAIAAFERANALSPVREFGRSNLGWLYLFAGDRAAAAEQFAITARLVPAKPGAFYSLGLSLRDPDLALDAFVLECLRDPEFVTRPLWQQAGLRSFYPRLLQRLQQRYADFLDRPDLDPDLRAYLRRASGSLLWWQGDFAAARATWEPTPVTEALLRVAAGEMLDSSALTASRSPALLTLAAWFDRNNRAELLRRAWALSESAEIPPELLQSFLTTMAAAPSFDRWVRQTGPTRAETLQRLGFGVLSRHVGGPLPRDYILLGENVAIAHLFGEGFASAAYFPALDRLLEVERSRLLADVAARSAKALRNTNDL